jgi:mRNA-degrading endonuclease RelE of RelBE toxin-antitoxin system
MAPDLRFHPAAARDLAKLTERDRPLLDRIERALREIQENPYAGEKKSGDLAECWAKGFTFRRVAYRIVYRIAPPRVLVLAFGIHDVAYRKARGR